MRTLCLLLLLATPATAQERRGESKFEDKAEEIVRQPLKDVGVMREKAPELLRTAQRAPYSLAGLNGCRDYGRAIGELDAVLGPDIDAVDEKGDPLPGRLTEAGAKTLVNALIPFRGLVREASGAAEADRKIRAALVAGTARRSFLKGYAQARGCRV